MTRVAPLEREALLCAAAAGGLAAILLWLAPPGTDFAAHAYQRTLFLKHGFVLWNNFWYAGRYSFVTYSLLYYPLAALLGIRVLALASVAAAALAFAVVVGREWGPASRLSTRSFAVLWAGVVVSAAFPFALGAALALLALWALQAGGRWRFAALALLTLAASPLAFVLLGVLLTGFAIARRGSVRLAVPVAVMTAAALVELLLFRLFPGSGRYPFHLIDLAAIALFCSYGVILTRGIEQARPLRWIFVVYFIACAAAFVVPTALGSNIERLRYAAFPIVLLIVSLRGWRPRWLVLPAIALTISWNVTPLAKSFANGERDPAASAVYWAPVTSFLHSHLKPDYRVEAVDTLRHWPAVYLPDASIPLVRGWYRQDDFPENTILYGSFGPRAYRAWLRRMAVRFVVLTDAPADYSSRAEAALLESGRSGLHQVFRSAHVTVFAVSRPHPIVTGSGPAHVIHLGATEATFRVGESGSYRVAIRYSPYWRTAQGCVASTSGGMTRLTVFRAGLVDLDFKVNMTSGLQVLTGSTPSRVCPG